MEKLTITKVFSTNQKKDGTPLINKFNKPYFRVGLKTDKYGENTWVNGFAPNDCKDLEGKTVELDITEEEYMGKKQLRFQFPRKEDKLAEQLKSLDMKLDKILGLLEQKTPSTPQNTPNSPTDAPDYPDEDIDPESIPF